MDTEYIKKVWANNFKVIAEKNLFVGTYLNSKNSNAVLKIKIIHKLYGWVIAEVVNNSCGCYLKQNLSNIEDFEIDNARGIIEGLK